MKVSGTSHSAENLEQCFMLAKRFVSGKNWGGFDENKLEKSRIEKTAVIKKKQKSDIACWAWENLILRQKLFDLKNLNAKNCKRGALWDFLNIHSVAKFRKIEARLEKFCKKKTKNENFQQSHSAEKSEWRTLWDFLTVVLLQNTKKMKGGIFSDIKKIAKKSPKAELTCTINLE